MFLVQHETNLETFDDWHIKLGFEQNVFWFSLEMNSSPVFGDAYILDFYSNQIH